MGMTFSLQDMVRQSLAEAEKRVKTAQLQQEPDRDESKKKDEKEPGKGAPKETSNTPERNYESYGEKTASKFVESLASAVEYLNDHFLTKEAVGETMPPPPHTVTPGIGPGIGQTSLETNVKSPTPGVQSEERGEAKTGKPPMTPGTDPKSPGQTNPGTALETTTTTPPGGSEDWTHQDKMKQSAALLLQRKQKTAQVQRILGIMSKMAGEDVAAAQIKATHRDVPPDATKSEEGVPKLPGEASKQESYVNSNEAARDYTKQQAKAVPKERMGEVIDEPAQKKSTDPVLHVNLDNAAGAGVKLSSVVAARALLRKIAEEGAKDDASPEEKERASKLQEALKAKQEEKKEAALSGAMPISGGY
jgi:hypothetical protein